MSYIVDTTNEKIISDEIKIKQILSNSIKFTKKGEIVVDISTKDNTIVEDNYANQYILKELISKTTDKNIICYDNGRIALENITVDPVLIFMDLHMPEIDGHETTVKLREKVIKSPIIALTANSMKNERIRCIQSGMDDFILKPIDIETIKNILQKYLV